MMLKVLYFLLTVQGTWAATCNPSYGPPGKAECVKLSGYFNKYQWATCLSNVYIQVKSHHRHQCRFSWANYCWYQCMVELHSTDSGIVTSDCSCKPSKRRPKTPRPSVTPTTSLPNDCYSPSGKQCDWYTNCLERKYSCDARSNAYAIKYAETFCRLYNKHKSSLTEKGRKWVDGVRKCLQVALVPLLRPWRSPTCPEIRKHALASYTSCYLNPDKDVPSVCDLDCLEYYKIFFLIKGSFTPLDTAWESMKGLWNIREKCVSKCDSKILQFTKVEFKFKKQGTRPLDSIPEVDARNRIASSLGSSFEKHLSSPENNFTLDMEVIDLLAFPGKINISNAEKRLSIYIVFADKSRLGIVNKTTTNDSRPFEFEDFQRSIVSFFQKENPTSEGYQLQYKSFFYCLNKKSCLTLEEISKLLSAVAVASSKPFFNNSSNIFTIPGYQILGIMAIALMLVNH